MVEQESHVSDGKPLSPNTRIAVIAPGWLVEALRVLLTAEVSIQLQASALTVEELLAAPLLSAPDIILINGSPELETAYDQIIQIKTHWPSTQVIILVDRINQQKILKGAGADRILIKGVSPRLLLSNICEAQKVVQFHQENAQ